MSVSGIKHRPHSPASAGGFTLIEVLIAMVLLMIGLLGVAQLHFSSFQENRNALYRNQATVIAEDLIDRVRGNPTGLAGGRYNALNFTAASSAPASVSCSAPAGCNAQELATRDVREWSRNFVTSLDDFIPSLPQAAGSANTDAADATNACPDSTKYDVTVSWALPSPDADGATRAAVQMSACL